MADPAADRLEQNRRRAHRRRRRRRGRAARPPTEDVGVRAVTDEPLVTEELDSSPVGAVARRPARAPPAGARRRSPACGSSPAPARWTVNGRSLDEYFPNKVHQQIVNEPFVTLDRAGAYDVLARLHGGGSSGQAGALRLGLARALIEIDPGHRAAAEEGGLPDPGRSGEGAQEVRPEEGPQGSAVLKQALMARRLFGTDGVRGVANATSTAELALDLRWRRPHVVRRCRGARLARAPRHRPAVVGRDPRASGEFLEAAVVAGLASAGVDVLRRRCPAHAGRRLPHRALGADLGVMLSASHNPMPDNGIKFFARGGVKLADRIEDEIEARIGEAWHRPVGAGGGPGAVAPTRRSTATCRTCSRRSPHRLDGLRVVVDCANGAASGVAPAALRRAGAEVVAIARRARTG